MIRRAGMFGALAATSMMLIWGGCVIESSSTDSTSTTTSGGGGDGGMGGGTTTPTSSTISSTSGGGGWVAGDCTTPVELVPGESYNGNTANRMDNIQGPCQQGSDGETVFQLNADATGIVNLDLNSPAADLGIYVLTTCGDPDTSIGCVDATEAPDESLTINVEDGTSYFVVIDGWDTGQAGEFTLTTSQILVETCDNGMDDNGNGYIDCEEAICATDPTCQTTISNACMGAIALTPNMAQMGDTTGGSNTLAATCSGIGASEQVYSYTPVGDEIISVTLQSATDQGVYLRSACEDAATQLACIDAVEGGTDEYLSNVFIPAATPLTLVVDGYLAGEEGPYTLTAGTVGITETEPNDDYMASNPFATGFTGYILPGDMDWIEVTMANPGNLTIDTADVFPGDCANRRIDTEVELYDADGMTSLGFNDDIDPDAQMGNWCSTLTVNNLAAGTYYLRVSGSQEWCPQCNMGYTVVLTN